MGSPAIIYKNLPSGASISAGSGIERTFDYMTTLAYMPTGTEDDIVYFGSFTADCVAVAGVNWESANASIEVRQGANVLASASGLRDNQPVLLSIPLDNYSSLTVRFNYDSGAIEIGEIAIGEKLSFPRNVSVGYSPARWHNSDLVTQTQTEGNQFAGSIVRSRAREETFRIPLLNTSYMEDQWIEFINNAIGFNVFFVWDDDFPENAVYGSWTAGKPSFTSSLLSEVNMTIKGVA